MDSRTAQQIAQATTEGGWPITVYWSGHQIVWGRNISAPRHLEIIDICRRISAAEVNSIVEEMIDLPDQERRLFGHSAGTGAVDLARARERAKQERAQAEDRLRRYAGGGEWR